VLKHQQVQNLATSSNKTRTSNMNTPRSQSIWTMAC